MTDSPTLRRVRVTWHADCDTAEPRPSFTDTVVLEDGLTDESHLPKILAQRHLERVSFTEEVTIDSVHPTDLISALIFLVGPPGCGKTTWAQARFDESRISRLDTWREHLTDNEADQSANPIASTIQKLIAAERVSRGLLTVIDGTNAEPVHRHPLITAARRSGLPIIVVQFQATVQECLDNMAGRARQVPEADVARIIGEIDAGSVDLVGTTDVHMTVDANGDTVKVSGSWRDIEYFHEWRQQLETRAKGGAR